jgi:tetratricopeptide (TPR) repeat protein
VSASKPGLVDILRDFLEVQRALVRVFDRYRRGTLRFEEVQTLFSDDEGSPLFRLKERCHELFRGASEQSGLSWHREVLFDLAVGSLFHEAMKFRESFYQREVYGPRVRALRQEAGEEAEELFREFEKILATVSVRLEEGLAETEALLARTAEQLVVLMGQHRANGHVARFLIERAQEIETAFGQELDALLSVVYGEPSEGFALAGRSYLKTGYYQESEQAFQRAIRRGGDPATLEPASAYARGMAAYLQGDYGSSVAHLASWADTDPKPEVAMAELAAGALSKIDQLAVGDDKDTVIEAASRLATRLSEAAAPAS